MNEKLTAILDEFSAHEVRRIVLSDPADKTNRCRRLTIRRIPKGFLLEKVVGVQAFQETLTPEAVMSCVHERLGTEYRQFNGWNELGELCISAGADGGFTCRRKKPQAADPAGAALHNRVKKHLLAEHDAIPPLIDMGVFTKDGRLVTSMADKYRQINRFLEFIEDVIGDEYRGKRLNAIDFGCGKSYLTFIMYHYLTVIKGVDAQMIGLDLKADVIQHCNDAARKYGYDGLSFQVGDISGYETGEAVDLVVTLHACDTATDHAMAHAVKWGARTILSVPCCQHELNGQMHSERLPVLCRYGIVQERMAALMTDAIRANLLTACGYKTQILEFVDLSHTPKNLLVRAVKAALPDDVRRRAEQEARALMDEFGFRPTLAKLLGFI